MPTALVDFNNNHLDRFVRKHAEQIGIHVFKPMDQDLPKTFDLFMADNLDIGNTSSTFIATTRVYFACDVFESLQNLPLYKTFDAFIGFGTAVHEKVKTDFLIDASKVIDGFVVDDEFENGFQNKDFDLFIACPARPANIFECRMVLDVIHTFLTMKPGISIGSNFHFGENVIASSGKFKTLLDSIDLVGPEYPMKYINRSNAVFVLSGMSCLPHFNPAATPKFISPGIKHSSIWHDADEQRRAQKRRSILALQNTGKQDINDIMEMPQVPRENSRAANRRAMALRARNRTPNLTNLHHLHQMVFAGNDVNRLANMRECEGIINMMSHIYDDTLTIPDDIFATTNIATETKNKDLAIQNKNKDMIDVLQQITQLAKPSS